MLNSKINVSIVVIVLFMTILSLQVKAEDYVLHYRIHKYDNKIGESVAWFVDNIFKPGDNLIFVSPTKSYRLVYKKDNSLQSKPEYFKKAITGALRKDSAIAGSEISFILESMKTIIREIERNRGSDLTSLFERYRQNRTELTNKTLFQLNLYHSLMGIAKKQKREMTCFTILQQVNQPVPGRELLDYLSSTKYRFNTLELFANPDISGKYKKAIKKTASAMSKGGLKQNFLFYKVKAMRARNLSHIDATSELYKNYKVVTKKTSGFATTLNSPAAFFQKWVEVNQ